MGLYVCTFCLISLIQLFCFTANNLWDMYVNWARGKLQQQLFYGLFPRKPGWANSCRNGYFGFVDLEKTFDRVPKEVIRLIRC